MDLCEYLGGDAGGHQNAIRLSLKENLLLEAVYRIRNHGLEALELSQREWAILECLTLNAGHIVSKSKLMSTILRFDQRPNASDSGAFEVVPWLFIFTNTGLSASCIRMYTDMASNRIDTRKGMRQPQMSKSAPMSERHNRMTSRLRNKPSVAVV